MKKLIKLAFLGLGLLVILGGLTALAIKIFLPPEKAKALVQSQLEARLHRQVELGNVSVGFLSGLRVDNFKISENPNFQAGTFVSSDRFSVRINWLALLFKKILVHGLDLKKPIVNLVRNADGSTNFSDLMSESPTNSVSSSTPSASSGSSFSLLVVKATVSNGELSFIDRSPKKQSVKVQDLNLTLRNIGVSSPLDLRGGCKIQALGRMYRIDLEANATMKGDTVIKRGSIESGVSRIELSGRLADLFGNKPSVDLTLALKNIETALLTSLGAVPAGLETAGLLDGNATLKGALDNLRYTTDLNLDKVKLIELGTFVKNEGAPLRLAAKGMLVGSSDLTMEALSVTLDGFTAEGDGRVRSLSGPTQTLTLRLNSSEFNPAELLRHLPAAGLPPELKMSGTMKVNLGYEGTLDKGALTFKTVAPNLDVAYTDLFHKPVGTPFSLEVAGLYSTPTAFTAHSLTFSAAGITMSGTASFASQGKSSSYQADVKSNSFPMGDVGLLVPAAKAYDFKGQGRLSAHVANGKKGLSYQADVSLENGELRYEQAHVTELKTALTSTPDSITIPSVTGKLDGASFKASAKALHLESKPTITVDASADALDLSKLFPSETPAAGAKSKPTMPPPIPASPSMFSKPLNTSGHVSIGKLSHEYFTAQSASLTWNLTGVTPELNQVSGTAALRTGAGGLTKNAQGPKTSLGKILLTPLTLLQKIGKIAGGAAKVPSLENLHFQQVIGDYKLASGMLTVEKFDLSGTDAQATMSGTAGLAGAQPLDLKVTMRGRSESTAVHLKIRGTISDPKVSLDLAEQGKQTLKAIQGGAADTLLQHFGLPGFGTKSNSQPAAPDTNSSQNQTPAEATPAQPTPEPEKPQKQIEDLLKGLLKR